MNERNDPKKQSAKPNSREDRLKAALKANIGQAQSASKNAHERTDWRTVRANAQGRYIKSRQAHGFDCGQRQWRAERANPDCGREEYRVSN